MSSEVETSLIVNSKRFLDFARNDKKALVTILIILASTSPALAQESATPAAAPESPTRNVRITFVPPPLGGEISLGIYDDDGKLVRVLKQEAALNEFEVGDDSCARVAQIAPSTTKTARLAFFVKRL